MTLSESEHQRFFRLIHGLQFYAIKRLSLDCSASTLEGFTSLALENKALVRDAVYESPSVITDYADENPDALPESDLACIRQWTKFIQGSFFVERHLKKYSIWIHDEEVYAVIGLSHPQEEILPKHALPLMVKAVILPFNGKIVFDGMLYHRSISFGGGMKRSFREAYMKAKQNGRIIESLEETPEGFSEPAALTPAKDWHKELEALEKATKAFKGEKHPLHKEAIALLRTSTKLATTALGESHENIDALIDEGNRVIRAISRFQKALDRADL